MLIKTQLRLAALLPGIFALAIGGVLWGTLYKVEHARQGTEMAEMALRFNFELNILIEEYLLFGGTRVANQLRIRHQDMGNLLRKMAFTEPDEQALVAALRRDHLELGSLYDLLFMEKTAARDQIAGVLLTKAQAIRVKARRLAALTQQRIAAFEQTADIVVMVAIVGLAGISMVSLMLIGSKLMRSIRLLDAGMQRITSGDLEHQITLITKDELGALAASFNSMARQLSNSYTSNDALHTEIAERKQAEESLRQAHARLRRFIDSNIIGIVIAAPDGTVIEANDYFLHLIDYTREEFNQGKIDWRALTPPEWLPADERSIQALREHGKCDPYEKEYLLRNGSRVPVYLADTLLPGAEEQIAAFVLDITERKRDEKEIRKLNTELEQRVNARTAELAAANQDLESFAYSVSHDLRTPLRAIDGFSLQVQKHYADKLDSEGTRYLKIVRDNTKKMSQLIDDILAFSRMGRLNLSTAEINMHELARAVFEELKPSNAEHELSVEIKPLPPCRGDLAMLRQAWLNLLGNAIKFTQHKTAAQIEVSGQTAVAENIYTVKDNGAGFDMRYADKLFGVFQRLHGNEEFEGTGIGLAIVKRIVTRHGGRVWGEGKVNEGATFHFALPI